MSDENPFLNRNPQIILEPETKKRGCPKCEWENFSGRTVGGMIYFKCLSETCGNEWQGGLPRVAEDHRKPMPPMNPKDKPRVMFDYDPRTRDVVEINYPVDLTQDFRKGLLIPDEDDYE